MGRREEAELGQCLDPALDVTLRTICFTVSGAGVAVGMAFEHEDDGAQYFVANDDPTTQTISTAEDMVSLHLQA